MDNEVKIQFKNNITGEKKLEKYKETLTQINLILNGLNTNTAKELETSAKNTGTISNDVKDIAKKTNIAFNYTTVRAFTRGLQGLTKEMGSYINKSATYLENMNLLDVAYNNNTESASKFVNKLSEMYGLDESWGYRTVGIFKQLSNAMGLAAEMGDKVSETMTQFAIDVSSLYNIDTNDAVSILTSSLAGQTKPARRLGADITQATLQTTLDQAGIDKKIADLSYAEKRLVIIASLLQQVQEANNDWSRTIESVSNQTRIMSEQWERLTRAFGNMLLPVVKQILPYVNGILMSLTEIFSVLASLLGYNEEDYDFFGQLDNSAIDLADNIANATGNTEKLKKSMLGLRSFDKIINISTPKKDSSGSGAGGLGVSGDIWKLANDQMDLYNLKLDNTQMKATKIRDSIMEWLGFSKQIDKETGKVSFKFDHITGGTVLGAVVVGGSIFLGITKLISMVQKFSSATGGMGALNASTLKWYGIITLAIGGFGLLKKGMNDMSTDSKKGFNEMGIGIGMLMGSFTLLGTKISSLGSYGGPIGMLAGSITGLVITVQNGFKDINTAYDSTRKAGEKYRDELEKTNSEIKNNIDLQITSLENNTKYIDKLKDITDANGNVRKGFEDRAEKIIKLLNESYGTDYKLSDRQITRNGKVVKSIDDVKKSIEKVIEQKKIEYVLEAYKDQYIKNLKTRKKAQEELNRKQETYNTMLKKIKENGKEALKEYNLSLIEYAETLDRQQQGLEDLQKAIGEYDDEIKAYDDLMEGHLEGNTKKINKSLQYYGIETKKSIEKSTKEAEKTTSNTANNIFNNIRNKFKNPFKIKFDGDVANVAEKIANLGVSVAKITFKSDGGIYSGGKWNKIERYDGGGMPSSGQLFWARENGLPEMVGQIGGHTAVMNNDQIVGSVANGVYRATKEANMQTQKQNSGTQVFNIYLDKNKKLATYTLNELQSMAKSNGKPIEIG